MLLIPPGIVRTLARLVRSPVAREDLAYEWRRRRGGEPPLPAGPLRRVLVLCHGNLCRSPFAAAWLAADPSLEVRSAGVGAADGHLADPTAARVATRFGIDLSAHRTRRVRDEDVDWAQLLIGMEGRHAAALCREFPAASSRVRLLGDFLPEPPHRILDPWGQSEAVFEETFIRIVSASARLRALIAASADEGSASIASDGDATR
jgi:protein-tyrosine phosphatase